MGHPPELGLPPLGGPSSGQPSNLVYGTPERFWAPFTQGFNAALEDLGKKKCSALYGGQGVATMKATQYRFVPFGRSDSNTGAATISPTSVFINSTGPYMTFSPLVGQAGPFGHHWTQPQFRAFILFHELGHQLSPVTGFQPDAQNLSLNKAQSLQVISACFE